MSMKSERNVFSRKNGQVLTPVKAEREARAFARSLRATGVDQERLVMAYMAGVVGALRPRRRGAA